MIGVALSRVLLQWNWHIVRKACQRSVKYSIRTSPARLFTAEESFANSSTPRASRTTGPMFVDPNLETCCLCFNLADGSLLVGIALLLHSVFCAIGSGYCLNLVKNSFDAKEEFNKLVPEGWPDMEILVTIYLIFNCVCILFHLILIIGVQP